MGSPPHTHRARAGSRPRIKPRSRCSTVVQVATAPGSGQPIRDANDVLRIGKGSDVATPIEVWNGGLDEVRIWPFARSAEDIQQSMNLELTSVPGYVSTWNLNNDFLDSSGGQHATSSGQATFTANPLALSAPIFAFGIQAGASSPGCLGDLKLCPSGPSVAGYNDFRVVCTRVPPAAQHKPTRVATIALCPATPHSSPTSSVQRSRRCDGQK